MRTDLQDLMDKYIFDRMSNEEKAQFEAEVNQDESKIEQLRFTKNIKDAISSREDKMAKLKMMQRMYDQKHQPAATSMRAIGTNDCLHSPIPVNSPKKKHSKQIWWWASGIVAVIVIGIFSLPTFNKETSTTDFSSGKIFNNYNYSLGIDSINNESTIKNDTISTDSTYIVIMDTLEMNQK